MVQKTFKNRRQRHEAKEAGFTLIDAAIGILLVGLVIAGFLRFQQFFAERESFVETDTKIATITDALSTFAQMRWRLPCPASPTKVNGVPFGVERVDGGGNANCDAVAETHGIIPYRTLGLPEQFAKDNYGHFFTYIVSPVYTRNNRIAGGATDRTHARLAHNFAPGNEGFLPKAQFCGGVESIDGTVATATGFGTDMVAQIGGAPLYGTDIRDDTTFVPLPASPPDPNYYRELPPENPGVTTYRIDTFAVAIISHGPNGYGAYLADDSGNRDNPAFLQAIAGASEEATATIDTLVAMEREIRRDGANDNEYDDIITVLTQDQVMAAAGGGSCEHP